MYVPAGVFGATSTEPSAFTVSGPLVAGVRITLAGSTAAPLSVSLVNTFSTLTAPGVPLTGPPASFTASIGAAPTVTVTVASSQLVGLSSSQMR